MNNQNTNNNKPTDVYTIVTNRIIEHLEKGVVPWQQSWSDAGLPKNLITGKHYRGINVWLLSALDYKQNYFLTFRQVKDLGGSVKKGEKSHEVIFWKWFEKENKETKEKERIPMLRYYRVFNVSQCDNIPLDKIPPIIERNNNPIETCEKIISEMPQKPRIQNKEQRAYYNRLSDYVNVPKIETFNKSEDYYGTIFHELVHSTGHGERLNRKELLESKGMRTDKYAIEELTAEMGASYLKSYANIPIEQLENNASYIQGWLERLKNDKKFIVYASSQAQKATDYILNISPEKEIEYTNEIESKENVREEELNKVRNKNNKEITIEI
ncbi:MAG: ArdC-like ssDNA-binding domain-containing protein [Bacteroidales bacterium]|jgi:antirestriction protein ArdC